MGKTKNKKTKNPNGKKAEENTPKIFSEIVRERTKKERKKGEKWNSAYKRAKFFCIRERDGK